MSCESLFTLDGDPLGVPGLVLDLLGDGVEGVEVSELLELVPSSLFISSSISSFLSGCLFGGIPPLSPCESHSVGLEWVLTGLKQSHILDRDTMKKKY